MPLSNIITTIINSANNYSIILILIVFLLSFGESLFFISLLLPATILLITLSILISNYGFSFFPVWIAASIGAFLGDWLSYWFGHHYKNNVSRMWLMTRYPQILKRGYAFFDKYGIWSVFLSRFFGPLRAMIPLIAGICNMPIYRFQTANLFSSMIWALVILSPGAFNLQWLIKFFKNFLI